MKTTDWNTGKMTDAYPNVQLFTENNDNVKKEAVIVTDWNTGEKTDWNMPQ